MSASKHIDVVCVVVLLCTLLVTALFMNGEALGVAVITDGDAGDGQFTANDCRADWDTSGATEITLAGDDASVKGDGAYVYGGDIHIVYGGRYVISGTLTNGSIVVDADSNDKIWILLNGVSLHCEDNAAILVEQAEKVFLTLADGTENVVSTGAEYTADAVSRKIDGAIYSRDDLTINGGGSLRVTAAYKHGIVCNDDLVITGGDIEITAEQDGVHANDSFRFADADITVNAGDDGITVSNDDETAYIYVESGRISIPSCYEGLEAIDIAIAGGVIDIRPEDDGINANGQGRNSVIRITGGDITIINENGRDADGLDSNGSIDISGGNVFISVNTSSCALDYGSENGGVCEISGGTVVAAGGSAMAEGFDSSSEQSFIMYTTSTTKPGIIVTLENEAGETLISEAIPCSFSSVVISTPELRLGETCTISVGDYAEEVTVDNTSSSGGFLMGGMFGGRGGRMGQSVGEWLGGDDPEAEDGRRQDAPPELPAGNTRLPDMPEPPGEDAERGEMPQMPDGDIPDGEKPQMADDSFMRGGRRDQFAQRGQNKDWAQDAEGGETSVISPDTLVMVSVSVLFLMGGLVIALRVKH